MTKTHLLYLHSTSEELKQAIDTDGPMRCLASPPVDLVRPTLPINAEHTPLLLPENAQALNELLAISCEDSAGATLPSHKDIDHHLTVVATALQLVKPTSAFCQYQLQLDSAHGILSHSTATEFVALRLPDPYLAYQQHHTIVPGDARRAIALLPRVSQALLRCSSWTHPSGSIHRALVFFCQGYTVDLPDLRQLLWAAGLDCLFASKTDKHKRGARIISERLRTFWGAGFRPYAADTVNIPIHQTRPDHRLTDIVKDIFQLRNAFMHGLSIPEAWLSKRESPESGYAYQLCECTEILLRLTLVKLFEDPVLFDVFRDPRKLDRYF